MGAVHDGVNVAVVHMFRTVEPLMARNRLPASPNKISGAKPLWALK